MSEIGVLLVYSWCTLGAWRQVGITARGAEPALGGQMRKIQLYISPLRAPGHIVSFTFVG